jgi:ribosomal protein L37E
MSYTTTYTCDRCGQTMTEGQVRHDVRIERMVADMSVAELQDQKFHDLCDRCGEGVRAYLKGDT